MTDVFAPQTADDSREFVSGFSSDGTATFERVGFTDLDFSAIFGQVTTSTTQNAVAYGIKGFTLDYDNGSIKVGYPLQCQSLDDTECFMQGVVTLKDTTYSPAYIEVAITIISPLVNTTNNWELSVVPVAGFSINPSATVGISTTSIDASGAGPFTFTTQTGKLFMQPNAIGGTVVCAALDDPKTYLFARVVAFSGASLVLSKIYSNATVAVAAWSIQLFDGPDSGIETFDINGLQVILRPDISTTFIGVSTGSVRDSTDTVDLVLSTALTKDAAVTWSVGDAGGGQVVSALLSGTISNSGTAVTGVGTTFTTDFRNPSSGVQSAITSGIAVRTIVTRASNTSLATFSSFGSLSGATYRRGGWSTEAIVTYYVTLIRKDSDGSVDVAVVTLNNAGAVVDLPSGYTYYRIIAGIVADGGALISSTMAIDSVESAPVILYGTNAAFPNAYSYLESASISASATLGLIEFKRKALTGDVTATDNSNATTIAANAVTNTKLNDMAAYTLKGRNAGTTGDPSDIDISALTEKVTVADADLFLIQDSAASNAFKKVQKSNIGGAAAFPADMGLITEAATITFDAGTVP